MPMGLTNAPTTFMHTMNSLFSSMLDLGIEVFLEDILMYTYIVKEQFTLLKKLLTNLHQYIFYCIFQEGIQLSSSLGLHGRGAGWDMIPPKAK